MNENYREDSIAGKPAPDTRGPTSTTLKIAVEFLRKGEVYLFQILVNPGTQTKDVIQMLAPELGSRHYELYHHPSGLPFEYPMFHDESVYALARKGFKFYLKPMPSVFSRLGRFIEANYYLNHKAEIDKNQKEPGL